MLHRPLRPPAVPLVTVDPYFSVWSSTTLLYASDPAHWTGRPNTMIGLILIDGVPYRFMGLGEMHDAASHLPTLGQKDLIVTPLSTRYRFGGAGMQLEVTFTTPLLLDQLDLLSRPVTYLTFAVQALDQQSHAVKIYLDVTGEWCVDTPDQKIIWAREPINPEVIALKMGTKDQPVLKKDGDDRRIDWGYLYLIHPQRPSLRSVVELYAIRDQFAQTGEIPEHDLPVRPMPAKDEESGLIPVMACMVDFGTVGADAQRAYVLLAYDDIKAVEYFNAPLESYWRRNGQSFPEMIACAVAEYDQILAQCDRFDRQLLSDAEQSGGKEYADILALSYRQAINAHKLVTDQQGNLLFFSKENFSNGCMGTVDVSYPSMPLFLLYNPELVKGMLRPIFTYARTEAWEFPFAPHDVGRYPKANGQVYGDNQLDQQMPVEECGNVLIICTAISVAEQNARFAEEHWDRLTQWAQYLSENGLDPGNQLCTDDFAGHLAHNTNLALKAILGIAGYALLCQMLNKPSEHQQYVQIARNMAQQWETMAFDTDHYRLAFDQPGTWSLKYNLVWDELFGLHLFSPEVTTREVAYYLKKQARYGVPLDNRAWYTKSDWLVWIAALAGRNDDFRALLHPLWRFLHETPDRVPFCDWYLTDRGTQCGFQNRSVVGGHFMKLLKDRFVSRTSPSAA